MNLNSFLFGVRLSVYENGPNGRLELWLINGKKVLNSKHANQSFDSLHRIFQKLFLKIDLIKSSPENILLLGLGGGSVPTIIFDELHLDCHITAVEHDPIMIAIARKEFDLDRFKNLSIVETDAFKYVIHAQHKFDFIIVDLFIDNHVPIQFCEEEFNTALINLLNKGKIIFNFINCTLAQAAQFERLHQLYKMQRNLLVSNYHMEGNNDVLIAERKG